ncbi:MAG: transcriptional regulator, partial [Catenulispora sp.]|nr:transcriptional regulator [Catenulispora sp.]
GGLLGQALLGTLRDVGRATGPRAVAEPLRASARVLRDAAGQVDGEPARRLWLLAARFAEYAGWMAQEAGNDVAALRWTRTAVQWAQAGGDASMDAYALVRRALMAQHRGDAAAVVEFARRAGDSPVASGSVRVFAARREAAGHALLGDHDACMRALQRSREELERLSERESFGWGPRADLETSALIEASCLLGLGRYESAADLFDGLDRLSTTTDSGTGAGSGNSHTRFALRRATALLGCGAVEQACAAVGELLPAVGRLDSATIRADLATFLRLAAGHADRGAVRELTAQAKPVLPGLTTTG